MTVEAIYRAIDEIAPFSESMDFDNTGILVGDPQAEVTDALLCLDVTMRVLREALDCGAGLIISHHPVIFHKLGAVLRRGRLRDRRGPPPRGDRGAGVRRHAVRGRPLPYGDRLPPDALRRAHGALPRRALPCVEERAPADGVSVNVRPVREKRAAGEIEKPKPCGNLFRAADL